jgi:monoamine oxidase
MPRTPLLSRLCALSAHFHAHRQAELAPQSAFDRHRSPTVLTRRTFVQSAGAVAAAAALGGRAWPGAKALQPKIAVVGAGLAGLVAAWRLKQHGFVVPIYEASARAGGRVQTDFKTFAVSGQRVERGGELIDSGHKRMRKLVKKLGLELDDLLAAEPQGTAPLAQFAGQAYTFEQAEQDFAAVYPKLHKDVVKAGFPTTYAAHTPHGYALDHLSIEQWIEARVPGGLAAPFGQLLATAYDIEYGAPVAQQSALNLVYLLGYGSTPNGFALFGESDERFRVRGGNQQVPDRLAALLSSQLRPQHRLVALKTLSGGRTRLSFDTPAGPLDVVADRVILSVPFAVLRDSVDVSELALQPLKRTAIETLGMGTNVKVHVQFVDRHWYDFDCNGETFADTGFQNTWEETRAQPGTEGILNNFLGSHGPLVGHLPPEGAADALLAQIEPLLPGISGKWNGVSSIDSWPDSPYQKGSYSYWKVGQYTQFAGVEREPEGHVHFAGEHTSLEFQGYMEGAVESGARAAAEVLDAL